jgi:hypothetical protein
MMGGGTARPVVAEIGQARSDRAEILHHEATLYRLAERGDSADFLETEEKFAIKAASPKKHR